jgi:lipopolysaccharide transport system permease protein
MFVNNLNLINVVRNLIGHRYLIGQLVKRDILLKYRGSYLGIGWSFLYPLLLLCVFTLVVGGVFGGRWGGGSNGMKGVDLALFIYCALTVFSPFSEVVTTVPRLLLANQNLVKKIIFPTEVLPLVSLLSASAHGAVNLGLLVLTALLIGHVHLSAMLAPVVLLPAWLFALGMAWFLAAAGAYVRDLAHIMPVVAQLLMFILPVFYPLNAAPAILRTIHNVNPLARAMQDLRQVILAGQYPSWHSWLGMMAIGLVCAVLGYVLFARCREEFADVL